ncbi:hypothetical protein QBC37DRAFT_373544 [Rhypophila decipiens]|uniref:Uncharacterized protein n=1 Tax=Rhypophila decipiens TaxID=261697 RepID=A0AAN7B8E6_9PEZI|nr:hypothetical protein QBC37DRAFT_373544 [Rhypophila decipiens]
MRFSVSLAVAMSSLFLGAALGAPLQIRDAVDTSTEAESSSTEKFDTGAPKKQQCQAAKRGGVGAPVAVGVKAPACFF